ncbi:MAG: amidohydrolase family protein [Clostridiales Family XIII bacterium]|jgi:predicted amidohydrolase YtcJ|nr:amidohydrolase family protein [Clostridiales Family XIII bacterium]
MAKVDLILKSDNIFDGVGDKPFAGAIAVAGNRIVCVGDAEKAEAYADDGARVYELGDKLITPGFIDAHMHYFSGIFMTSRYMCSIYDCKSEAESVERLAAFAAEHPEFEQIAGIGWQISWWGEGAALPTKASLDARIPDRPVFVYSADGHCMWLNSKALAKTGVTAEATVSFGEICKDENGELTGTFLDMEAIAVPSSKAFDLPNEEMKALLVEFNRSLSAAGVTSATDMAAVVTANGDTREYQMLYEVEQEGKLNVRLHLYPGLGTKPDVSLADGLRGKYKSDKLRIAGLKQFVDGVTYTFTAALLEPYTNNPSTKGKTFFDYETIRECVLYANKNGYGVKLHCIGDAAVKLGLDVYEESHKAGFAAGVRNCVEHIEALRPEDIPRFAELGVIASMQPLHVTFNDNEKILAVGEERAKYQWPFKSVLRTGATIAFGTDFPVVTFDPIPSLHAAVTRTNAEGKPMGTNPDEKLSLAETIKAYTIGGAYTVGREEELGTLEAGKLADIVVFDRNLFGIEAREILNAKVRMTVQDGEIVYEKL